MTSATDGSPDRSALVYRYHERLYRLALLVSGDADAATALLERAYREHHAAVADSETLLVRALLPPRPTRRRWRWAASDGALLRSMLDRAGADALLATLARLLPAERLVIGLTYLGGCSPEEISAQLGDAVDLDLSDLLARWRAGAARAVGLVPADADPDTLLRLDRWIDGLAAEEDAIALRRAVLEQPDMRALRDGMIAVRELLRRAIPALFAAAPPHALTERLLTIAQGRQRSFRPSVSARWAQGALVLGVLVLTAAIIGLPSLFAPRAMQVGSRRPAARDMIEAAIHRFDRAPLQDGVLHEQYRVERDNGAGYLIERWYDYASPHRLAISVKTVGREGPPLMQISSDGRSRVQFRNGFGGPDGQRSIDAHVSEDEARAVLPLLRGQPLARLFPRGPEDNFGDLGPLYLAQARAAGAAFLGTTTMLDRQSFLLTYRTEHPPEQPQSAGQPVQVVLTIDAETYALLDVALIPEGAGEGSAHHPIQALQFEVLAKVADDHFKLPSSGDVAQRTGIASVRFPELGDEMFLSLDDAMRRAPRALLAPEQLPDMSMRGLAIAMDDGRNGGLVALLYEGEFQNVVVLPVPWDEGNSGDFSQERSAGDFRYRIVRGPDFESGLAAIVYRPGTPNERLMMILNDEYATGEEREVTLQQMIASLTPVDEQSLPAIRRNFQASGAAGTS